MAPWELNRYKRGRALKLIGADEPWTMLQTSFYFNF